MQNLRRSVAHRVDKEELSPCQLNIRDKDHFDAVGQYHQTTLGWQGWRAQKTTLKKFKPGRTNIKRIFWLTDPSFSVMLKLL